MNEALTITYKGLTNKIISSAHVSKSGGVNQTEIKALWDTGATSCVISDIYAKKIGLQIVGESLIAHAGGSLNVNVYLADLTLPNFVTIQDIKVCGSPALNGFDFIIGMDIITIGDFCITNKNGFTKISFRYPSQSDIDFVKENENAFAKQLKKLGRNNLCPCGSGKKIKFCHGKDL